MIKDRYYYEKLTAKEKQIYNDFYQGALSYASKIKTIPVSNPKEAMNHVFAAIMADNPLLYYVDQTKVSYSYSSQYIEIEPTYIFSKSQIAAYNNKINEKAKQILTEVMRTAGNDDVRREKALFEYFVKHFTYDSASKYSKDPVRSCKVHSLLGVFLDGKAVCEGFAEAFKFLMNAMDMECIVVSGRADWKSSEGHAWNIVKLNGKYYHTDVTWAISRNEDGTIWYDYLNVSDKEISLDHTDFSGVPRCISNDLDYYKTVAPEIDNMTTLKNHMKDCIVNRKKEITFRLIKGRGRDAISNPANGCALIQEAVKKAHQESDGVGLQYLTKYTDKKNTFLVRFSYDR